MNYKYWKYNQAGFSLLELVIALGLAALVLAVSVAALTNVTRATTTQNVTAEAQQVARAGLDYMVRKMRQTGFDPSRKGDFGVARAGSDLIVIKLDENENGTMDWGTADTLGFMHDTVDNELLKCSVPDEEYLGDSSQYNCESFMRNVTGFALAYLDRDDADTTVLQDIRTVRMSLTVTQPAGRARPVSRTYSTRVNLRNIPD